MKGEEVKNADEKRYVTWQGLVVLIAATAIGLVSIGITFHSSAKDDLQKDIDKRVTMAEYQADMQWIKEGIKDIKKALQK